MNEVKVLILRTAGTNCDQETAFAFQLVGGTPDLLHINKIAEQPDMLKNYHIIALPGGFTYGDDVASGKILANEISNKFYDHMQQFIKDGKLIIGICNGFQVLVKSGILPVLNGSGKNRVTLSFNDSGKFEDRWVYLKRIDTRYSILDTRKKQEKKDIKQNIKCVWTRGLPEIIELPVAHGEGKFIPESEETLELLRKNNQVVFQYVNSHGEIDDYPWNPNGSVNSIAGICDPSGRILGLMPHPERYFFTTHHPRWTREKQNHEPVGLTMFRNGVTYARKNLLA